MKATKDHISLETAKLLKDCGVESEYIYSKWNKNINDYEITKSTIPEKNTCNSWMNGYPAFTWQEILWEYPDKFFEKEIVKIAYGNDDIISLRKGYEFMQNTRQILVFIQEKKYELADEYFREYCILIK